MIKRKYQYLVKIIDAYEHKNRIRELVSVSVEKRFDIPENSIKHYAKEKGVEYVLVRLK